ncbi:hypothetical protein BDI4_400047 [Burkholderia diffusa]|nr:hypothetical protein BDI4_400047 [Burkholderia diffusa]
MTRRGGSGPPDATRCNDEDDFLLVGGRAPLRGLCAGRRRRGGRQPRNVRDDRPGDHGAPLTGADFRRRRRLSVRGGCRDVLPQCNV